MKLTKFIAFSLAGVLSVSMFTSCSKKGKSKADKYSITACETTIDKFFTACKNGDIDGVIAYSDNKFFIENSLNNKEDISKLFKYVFSDLEWEFGLDKMNETNASAMANGAFETNKVMSFSFAYSQSYWRYFREAYISDKTSKSAESFKLPQTSDNMYSIMDSVKDNIPKVCKNGITLKIDDNGDIKVVASEFLEKTFRDYSVFNNASDPSSYIQYLIGSQEDVELHTSKMYTVSDEDEVTLEIKDTVFEMLKEKQDFPIFQYLFNEAAEKSDTVATALENPNYYVMNIISAEEDKINTINNQYADMLQMVVEYETDESQRRVAQVYRFYNTPANSLQYQNQFAEFIEKNNAYYNTFVFDEATYNLSEPIQAVKVFGDYMTNQ